MERILLEIPKLTRIINIETDILLLVIDQGIDLNERYSGGMASLMRASVNGNMEHVSLLLSSAVSPNFGMLGGSPLIRATKEGHIDIVRLLLEYGANPNSTSFRINLLEIASNNKEIYDLLVSYGAK